MKRFSVTSLVLLVTMLWPLSAQTIKVHTLAATGSGYSSPPGAQLVAPGQLITIYVYGIQTSIPVPVQTVPGQFGWPTTLSGISVDLVQGDPQTVTPVEIRAIYQAQCPDLSVCSPYTAITLMVPFSLSNAGSPFPVLRVSEGGAVLDGGVTLGVVTDRVHVINTCDDTQVFVSAASGLPQDVCGSVVLGNGAINSLYNLAHEGDPLSMWLYGMGTLQANGTVASGVPALAQNYQLNFDFRPNAPASPVVPGFGITASPTFTGYTGGGTYQVNFVLPPVPKGLPACDGGRIKSNLTVTLTGPRSYDAAQICVAP